MMKGNNKIIGTPTIINSDIKFKGNNNILYCEQGVTIKNSYINFKGDNAVVYLSSNRHTYYFQVTIYNNSVLYFGENNYMNKQLHIILSEQKNVVIGDECLFAIGAWIRTSDPHIIYDSDSRYRINPSKSVFIGDHVWCGQEVLLLKGSKVGSGCIIGGRSVVSGKELLSNTIYAGNPVKKIRSNIFHSKKSVSNFTEKETDKYNKFIDDRYVYSSSRFSYNLFEEVDYQLSERDDSEECLKYIKDSPLKLIKGGRFYIGTKDINAKKKRKITVEGLKKKLKNSSREK